MNQVADNITADVPDAMVDNQARQYLDNFKAQISRQFPYEEYKKMTGMDDEKLLDDAKEPALRQVRMDLATAAIIKAEKHRGFRRGRGGRVQEDGRAVRHGRGDGEEVSRQASRSRISC